MCSRVVSPGVDEMLFTYPFTSYYTLPYYVPPTWSYTISQPLWYVPTVQGSEYYGYQQPWVTPLYQSIGYISEQPPPQR
jgi:hypothetical protein